MFNSNHRNSHEGQISKNDKFCMLCLWTKLIACPNPFLPTPNLADFFLKLIFIEMPSAAIC